MKKILTSAAAILCAACAVSAQNPRQVFFTGDAECGISSGKTYTHAVTLGNFNNTNPEVLGVVFQRTNGNGAMSANPNYTWTWTGFPASQQAGSDVANISTPTGDQVYQILRDFNFNSYDGTLVLGGLTPGRPYEFRLYQRCWGLFGNRHNRLTFQGGPDHIVFNPDDARVDRYISYAYTPAGTTLSVRFQSNEPPNNNTASLHVYAFSNEEGVDPESILTIAGAPENYGVSEPPYGMLTGLGAGSNLTVSLVEPVWFNAAGNIMAAATGWETYLDDGLGGLVPSVCGNPHLGGGASNGVETSFLYAHPQGAAGRVVWKFSMSNLVAAASSAGGDVLDDGGLPFTNAWFGPSETAKLHAVPAAGHEFFAWAGDVPAGTRYDNPLLLACGAPRAVRAEFVPTVSGDLQYVATDGNDASNGLSWATAKLTIAAAAASLPHGTGTVLVAAGQYPVTEQIVLNSAVEVRGATGNPGDVHARRDASAGNVRVFRLGHAGAKVSFMTVRDGKGGVNEGNNMVGGNIYIAAGTVADCVVQNGQASNWGGHGGNIALNGPDARVLRCTVSGGLPDWTGYGGGIAMRDGRVEQCWITGNADNRNGGASAVRMWGGTLANCTLTRNTGNYDGGAVWVEGAGSAVLNCVIVDNWASQNQDSNGGSVFSRAGQAGFFQNCVADLHINPSCFTTADGFGFADAANNNYRLTAASFARGKGAELATRVSEIDFDGFPFPPAGPVDAGCWQYKNTGAFDFALKTAAPRRAVPFTAVFRVEAANAGGPVEYTWLFGEPGAAPLTFTTNAASFTVSFPYTVPGAHTVTVSATDDAGATVVIRTLAGGVYAAPAVIHVRDGDQAAAFPHDAWGNAAKSVVDAAALAADGTLILVSNGTHTVNSTLRLDMAATLRGLTGNPGDVRLRRAAGNHTLLVMAHPGARCEGVTLREAVSGQLFGGNVDITPRGGTVSNCVITAGNISVWTNGDGAGVHMRSDRGLVTHCVISNNTVLDSQESRGAGVRMTAGRLEHSLVAGNSTASLDSTYASGAGVHATGGNIINCTVAANRGRTHGGIYATGGARVVNTVLADNTSVDWGDHRAAWGGNALFTNCFSDTAAPIPPAGNFTATAVEMLANIPGNDFSPAPYSPLIDAGIDVSWLIPGYAPPAADLLGNDRVMGARMDAGCVEYDPEQLVATFVFDNNKAIVPAPAGFTASVGGTNAGESVRLSWDFGEGGSFTADDVFEAFHNFTVGGFHTVTLTVTNLTRGGPAATDAHTLHFAAPVLHVWGGTNPGHVPAPPFDAWTNATRDVQTAVDHALPGCEILIRAGAYTVPEADGYGVRVDKALRVRSEFDDPRTVALNPSGSHMWRVLRVNDPGAWVSGLTLQNARADGVPHGVGVQIGAQGGVVSNCVIRNCYVSYGGTGVAAYLDSPAALLTHCEITENFAHHYNANHAFVYVNGGRVENCLVHNNWMTFQGHDGVNGSQTAAFEMGNNAVVRNCTVVDNRDLTRGVFWFKDGSVLAEFCVAAGNTATPLYAGANRLVNNTVDSAYGLPPNPDFRCGTPQEIFKVFATTPRDYRLGSGSPAINAGPRLAEINFPIPSVDLDNRPRVLGGKLDHGCFEANAPGTLFLVK